MEVENIELICLKGKFGDKKNYFGYKKYKSSTIIKITLKNKIIGVGETLAGVYSPKIVSIIFDFIKKNLKKKITLKYLSDGLNKFKKNKFLFNEGIFVSVIAGIECAIFDIYNQIGKDNKFLNYTNLTQRKKVEVYASCGSILSTPKEILNDINNANRRNFNKVKIRINLQDKNLFTKIKIAQENIENYAIDLICNTFDQKANFKKMNLFLEKLSIYKKKPLWIEEFLFIDDLFIFNRFKKKFNFSYGENFNSLFSLFTLLDKFKFKYINPDISHLPISEFIKLNNYIDKTYDEKKILIHSWGGPINIYLSLILASIFNKSIYLVEYPTTYFSINKKLNDIIEIKNSKIDVNSLPINRGYDLISNLKNFKNISNFSFKF